MLKFSKQPSVERKLRSIDRTDCYYENNTMNSNRIASDYENMLRTANSFGSFNNSGQYIPQYPQSSRMESLKKNKILLAHYAKEPVYTSNTILLEKKPNSYPMNNSQASMGSMVMSRESMNLTPQLLSPDEYNKINNQDKENIVPRLQLPVTKQNIKEKFINKKFVLRLIIFLGNNFQPEIRTQRDT